MNEPNQSKSRFNPLLHSICFATLVYSTLSEWIEHRTFGLLLVELLMPSRIFELGTGYGVSYPTFCQAVKQLDLGVLCN